MPLIRVFPKTHKKLQETRLKVSAELGREVSFAEVVEAICDIVFGGGSGEGQLRVRISDSKK